ncbi:MAG: hypothetical protein ACPL1B_09605, partial [Thermoprotei archaeon]
MSYNNTPFNYYGTQTDQVKIDLDNANNNFSIIANAFKDNSPDTGIVKNADSVGGFTPSQTPQANQIPVLDNNANLILPNTSLIQTNTYTIRRVDLTNASSDYPLAVGEEAIINFTDATSVPLHIATQDGTLYTMILPRGAKLLPNNTSYSNSFVNYDYGYSDDGNGKYGGANADNTSSFPDTFKIGHPSGDNLAFTFVYNKTALKSLMFFHITSFTNYPYSFRLGGSYWKDTTTAWTSLGTITFAQSTSGQILVRRI